MISDEAITEGEPLRRLVRDRIRRAIEFRERHAGELDSYRVVFSDADLLPGLIVDRYNDILALQVLTQAMDRDDLRQTTIETLQRELKIDDIVERTDAKVREREEMTALPSRQVLGARSETEFHLNGIAFRYQALEGQKTGAFLDQRQNYAAAERYARGRALDVCTYQGGFALHLARSCDAVTAVEGTWPRATAARARSAHERRSARSRRSVSFMVHS